MKLIFRAILLFIMLTLLTGVIYPLVITLIAKSCFPREATGSLVRINGKIVGSELLAQDFESLRYFHSRFSFVDFRTIPSGASNYGPTSKALKELVEERMKVLRKDSCLPYNEKLPQDMLFASGSGLDPHISPGAALFQIKRIVKYRKLNSVQEKQLEKLVRESIEYPQFGFLGEYRVNVLLLNISLDRMFL